MQTSITSNFAVVGNSRVHYLQAGVPTSPAVIFLHGASFNSHTWLGLKTLELLGKKGYYAVAVDLPGFGSTMRGGTLSGSGFLSSIFDALDVKKPVLVSPSMSGNFSLPLVAKQPELLTAFVAVAPVGIPQHQDELKGNALPTLAIWGGKDRIVPAFHQDLLSQVMTNVEKVTLDQAGHACYMNAPEQFHKHLLDFLGKTSQ